MKTLCFASLLALASCAGPSDRAASGTGPIRVSPNGRHFVDSSGAPFFWLGDTAWKLFEKVTLAEAELYLEDRRRKGFTVVQAVCGGSDTATGFPNLEGHKPWVNDNPATPNEAYFRNVDAIVTLAREKGIVVGMLPSWGWCVVQKPNTLNLKNARVYGKWLGTRYRTAPNLIWIVGGDVVPPGYEPVFREVAAGLKEGDGGAHIMTYHPPGGSPSSSQWFHNEPWLDFNMLQTWDRYSDIYSRVYADYRKTPAKPTGLGEGAYEDGPQYPTKPIDALAIRRQAYWSYLAGGYHTYGNTNVWNFGTAQDKKEVTQDWKKALDSAGARHLQVLKKIFLSQPWWKLVPDPSLFSGAEKIPNAGMVSADGDRILAYFASAGSASIPLTKIASAKEVDARWINPTDTEETPIGRFPTSGAASFTTPAGWSDALLLLQAVVK